jgi:NAD-dependent deacetylase
VSDPIQQAAAILKQSLAVCALTGAGVSKESGVPTFRDALEGLWANYDPEQLATRRAYENNPKMVWDWYAYRRERVAQVQPNPGHHALKDLERHFQAFTVITQNVDSLHEAAGSQDIIHLHGELARTRCFYDCNGAPTLVDLAALTYDKDDGPPQCPNCGRKSLRPDVVWFGEMLPEHDLSRAMHISQMTDAMLVIGTSGLVTPAATLPRVAKEYGAKIIEVNPDYSMITRYADVKLEGPSGEMLPKLVEALNA